MLSQNEAPSYCGDFWEKHGPSKLLLSSAYRGWSGLTAELRSHGKGVIPWKGPQFDTHICLDVHGRKSRITRQASGIEDCIVTARSTIWLSPPGWREGSIDIAEDLPGILHLYVSPSQFSPSKLGIDIDASSLGALTYEAAFEDPLFGEMAHAIATELKSETSAGKLLVESLTNSMAARLIQKHVSTPIAQSCALHARGGLDRRRLFRVLDYIEANLEGDLCVEDMASIACLSRYHFARAFRQSVGQSPHSYVSAKRLEHAKAMLISGNRSLIDIALSLSFSSQANFARAFKQATGLAPGQYRRQFGSRHRTSPSDNVSVNPVLSIAT
ncbi:helix-turn-helix domain-containing protein [Bradyrhizobium sp. CER78]|uniref:helix-turn-helix domain-containing protein n=1 Tax=Bradyrhizobium sp. CER78 TaxID=3039162 RepID=UPI00244A3B53|nr:helix-turn-helix domain-containing protein [Bradyrhizobium sp. CER78]MDH2384955.1 helix-turn-helix domain-containing protein [Bradyrhizobium sp. CER78]